MASLGAIHKASPGSAIALPSGDPSEVGMTRAEWGALCTGDECHDGRAGLWRLWLLYQHETHAPHPLVTSSLGSHHFNTGDLTRAARLKKAFEMPPIPGMHWRSPCHVSEKQWPGSSHGGRRAALIPVFGTPLVEIQGWSMGEDLEDLR